MVFFFQHFIQFLICRQIIFVLQNFTSRISKSFYFSCIHVIWSLSDDWKVYLTCCMCLSRAPTSIWVLKPPCIYDASYQKTILGSNKIDEARRRKEEREEKRQQRQKEVEEKRAARKGGGALKLGAKKTALDWLLPVMWSMHVIKKFGVSYTIYMKYKKKCVCLCKFFICSNTWLKSIWFPITLCTCTCV